LVSPKTRRDYMPTLDITKEQALETYRSMISIGTEALKALQLINGGAIVAILAYLGQATDGVDVARRVADPLWFFVAGLVVATLSFLTTYFTQYYLFNDFFETVAGRTQKHVFWLCATVVLALASVALFSWGSLISVAAFGKP
jgi:hypothetical protein